jgi:hypothetical protein
LKGNVRYDSPSFGIRQPSLELGQMVDDLCPPRFEFGNLSVDRCIFFV